MRRPRRGPTHGGWHWPSRWRAVRRPWVRSTIVTRIPHRWWRSPMRHVVTLWAHWSRGSRWSSRARVRAVPRGEGPTRGTSPIPILELTVGNRPWRSSTRHNPSRPYLLRRLLLKVWDSLHTVNRYFYRITPFDSVRYFFDGLLMQLLAMDNKTRQHLQALPTVVAFEMPALLVHHQNALIIEVTITVPAKNPLHLFVIAFLFPPHVLYRAPAHGIVSSRAVNLRDRKPLKVQFRPQFHKPIPMILLQGTTRGKATVQHNDNRKYQGKTQSLQETAQKKKIQVETWQRNAVPTG
mmetsp:Transcript_18020/g.26026  ORF Transcript_18020/g.26026 Transcript_18020/m.26026 type:complete len:294 (-) Transcript_18020:105-986(-)